jgi:hypothetical protein
VFPGFSGLGLTLFAPYSLIRFSLTKLAPGGAKLGERLTGRYR